MKEYFSHDFNARNDSRMIKLQMKYGLEGVGAYWCIIEMLYEEDGYLMLSECERIAFEMRTHSDMIADIINNFDLFVIEDEIFYSESALRRLNIRKEKSDKARKSAETRWKDANALQTQSESNAIKVNKSKVNTKEYIYNKFYDSEISNTENEKYHRFVKYLFGENSLKEPLKGVLSISNQLTEEQFEKIMEKCEVNKVKVGEILTKIENDKKYYKGKTSLYRTLLNWTKGRFVK